MEPFEQVVLALELAALLRTIYSVKNYLQYPRMGVGCNSYLQRRTEAVGMRSNGFVGNSSTRPFLKQECV